MTPKAMRLSSAPDHWDRPSRSSRFVALIPCVCHDQWGSLEEEGAFSSVVAWVVIMLLETKRQRIIS
jgi:hypothetical protein